MTSAILASGTELVFADWQFQPLKALARAGVAPIPRVTRYYPTLAAAVDALTASAPGMNGQVQRPLQSPRDESR